MLDQITEILARKYGSIKLRELTGGYTNGVFLLEGAKPALVAKISNINNCDSLKEIESLCLLNGSNFTPQIYETIEYDQCRIIIMDYVLGENGQSFLDKEELQKSEKVFEVMGKYLAEKIHSNRYIDFKQSNLPIKQLINEKSDTLAFIPQELQEKVNKTLIDIKEDEEKYVLIHGDYGPHNILYNENHIKIIDWEWSGWGSHYIDISWVAWFLKLHYPDKANRLFRIFINSYRLIEDIKINSELLKKYALFRVINVMMRINKDNIPAQNEWLRRLSWTLESEFDLI